MTIPKDEAERERESASRGGRGGGEEERKGRVHGAISFGGHSPVVFKLKTLSVYLCVSVINCEGSLSLFSVFYNSIVPTIKSLLSLSLSA